MKKNHWLLAGSVTTLTVLALAGLAACKAVDGDDDDATNEGAFTGNENETSVPKLGARIDRVGRPEVSTFLVRVPALKPQYNGEDSFADTSAKYQPPIKASLAMYDGYDRVADMDDAMLTKLSKILVDDYLRIDLSKPCPVLPTNGYFDLERAELLGKEAASCGGRSPNEDAFDALATFYTNGPSKLEPRVTDLVDKSTGEAGTTFPYLAKPHLLRAAPPPATPPNP